MPKAITKVKQEARKYPGSYVITGEFDVPIEGIFGVKKARCMTWRNPNNAVIAEYCVWTTGKGYEGSFNSRELISYEETRINIQNKLKEVTDETL